MKGFMIYETPLWGDKENVVYVQEVGYASYTLKQVGLDDITCYLDGIANGPVAKATCNKEDTYDFEIGALIALMKKCGVEKVKKAVNEYEEETHALKEEIKRLKGESENRWKIYKRNIQKKQDRINELQDQIKANETLKKDNESFRKSLEKLKEENKELHKNIDELFESDKYWKSEAGRLNFEKHRLEEKVEKLKLDCEMLQHGYNDMIYKPPTKREEMWEKIFELHKERNVIIKVKREDINTFLHELENKIPEITWASGVKIFETKHTIGDIYEELKRRDAIYFRLWIVNKLSYSSDPHIYPIRVLKHIDYLLPMRWDLFKKGRLVVKVDSDNYEDFYNKCEVEIGRKPHYIFNKEPFTVYYKKGTYHTRPYDEKIPYKYKVVDWEDVK